MVIIVAYKVSVEPVEKGAQRAHLNNQSSVCSDDQFK